MAEIAKETPLSIPEEMSDSLAMFVGVPTETIKEVFAQLENVVTADITSFVDTLAKDCGGERTDIYIVVTTLRNLKSIQSGLNCKADALIRRISIGLKARWESELMKEWQARAESLTHALDKLDEDSSLMISAKTSTLAYLRQNVLHKAQIISDIRPVFNQAATEIKRMIVTHSLILYYTAGEEQHELHLTMDWKDVQRLLEECERAGQKGQLIIDAMSKNEWKTCLFPEPEQE